MVDSGNTTVSEADDAESRPARIAFLALIMVVAGVANILLVFGVLHGKKLRQSVQNITIVNLSAVSLCDCFLNMSLVMGSLAASDWSFGETLCRWHSFVMNLVLVETILTLIVLTSDRYLAVRFLQKYEFLISPVRLVLVITFTWVQSLAFSIPFLFDTVYTTFRPRLHTCSVSDQTPLTFICFASVLCFLAPAIAIIVIFILIFRLAYKQRHEIRTLKTQNHYTDVVMEEPRLSQEMWTAKMICVLFLLWFILEVPYIITTYIQQYHLSKELSFSVEYPWGVDIAFIWMRFSYSAIFPCAVFIWKRELWHCVKECMTCHRNNSVVDIEISVKEPAKSAAVREMSTPVIPSKSRDRDQKQELTSTLAFNVPVLFATSDGIHIETPQTGRTESELFYTEILSRTQLKELPAGLKGRQLDVGDSDADEVPLPADTSDYDSSSEGGGLTLKTTSAWHADGDPPETLHHSKLNRKTLPASSEKGGSGDVAETPGADSGLELSGTVGSSAGKGIQKLVETSQKLARTRKRDSEMVPVSQAKSAEQYAGNSVPDQRVEKREGFEEWPPISPSTDVVPVWDSPVNNTPAISDCVQTPSDHIEQHTHHNLPKAPGRLKPLSSERKRKGKKSGQGKKLSSTEGTAGVQRTGHDVTNGAVLHGVSGSQQEEALVPVNDSGIQNSNPVPKTSSRNGRGHKRTKTSDSQKSLLGSNSSVELQHMKAQSHSLTDGDIGGVKNGPSGGSGTF